VGTGRSAPHRSRHPGAGPGRGSAGPPVGPRGAPGATPSDTGHQPARTPRIGSMTPAESHEPSGADGAGSGATRWEGTSGRAERLRHVRSCRRTKQRRTKQRRRRPARHEGGDRAPTPDERRRFDELVRQIDQESATGAAHRAAGAIPARRVKLAVSLIGLTGVLAGLATDDALVVVIAMAGVAATVVAAIVFAFADTPGRAPAPPTRTADGRLGPCMALLERFWLRLTTCAEDGCRERPAHLGWCSEHAPDHAPRPDEYWGEYRADPDGDRR